MDTFNLVDAIANTEPFNEADAQKIVDGTMKNLMAFDVDVMVVEEDFEGLDDDLTEKILDNYGKAATAGSAGIDLRYIGNEPLVLAPGDQKKVSTGLAIYLKDPSFVGVVTPRSGKGNEGLVLGNLIGIIDSDYQKAIELSLWNRNQLSRDASPDEIAEKTITVTPGERVAQYMVIERIPLNLNFVKAFSEETERTGGFGSTGRF